MDPLRHRRDRLKRRLLAEVIEENVAELSGRPRRAARRAGRGWAWLAAAVLPLALVAGSRAVTVPAEEEPAAAPAAAAALPAAAVPAAPARPLPPPAALDPVDPAVFPLAVERVVIDPGHGGEQPGAWIASGTAEKDLTLDIALRLRDLLAEAGFAVTMTRQEDREISLEERARIANAADADLFVSIHVNWIVDRDVRGVETYYLGATDDPFVTRLAAAENVDSGYSQADLRSLLASVYAGLRDDASRRAAAEIQRALLRSLRSVNPALADRGVKTAPFLVLAETEMPAVLAEVSCLSNHEEAELLGRPLYRQYIAEALAAGIVRFAEGRGAGTGGPAAAG